MIRTQSRQVECQEETALVCDRCGREITPDEDSEWSEAVRIRFTGGYGSVFGDGARVEADLCQRCVKELIGPFCRIVSRHDWRRDPPLRARESEAMARSPG